jgi:two-component system, OmpR family, KDP operon response regulator KdpE
VLVISDRPETLRVLAVILTAQGYRTDVADGAAAGLAAVARCQPDGVIVELAGPDVNGADFIRRLRELTKAPVIALSGSAVSSDKVAALDAGADDTMSPGRSTRPNSLHACGQC